MATLSDAGSELLDRLPDGWVDADPILPDVVHALATAIDELDAVAADDDELPGWVKLVDPQSSDTPFQVRFAAQFAGARVRKGLSLADARAEALRLTGWKRGTPAAIRAAAAPFLRHGEPELIERAGGDAWALTIRVRDDQVGGERYWTLEAQYVDYAALQAAHATYDDLSGDAPGLTAAVLAAVPAGIVATVEIIPDFTYGDFDAGGEWADYAALAAALADYQALTSYDPS